MFYVGSGLRKLVFGNFSYAMGEFYRGINKAAQVKELQKFVPSLKNSDVIKSVAKYFYHAIEGFPLMRVPAYVMPDNHRTPKSEQFGIAVC